MNISANSGNSVQLYQQQQTEKTAQAKYEQQAANAPSAVRPKEDSVQLSQDAKLMAEANRVASSTDDVRADKVARLRTEVQNGTYEADSTRIAEGLIREESALFSL